MRAVQFVFLSFHTAVKLVCELLRNLLVVLCEKTEKFAGAQFVVHCKEGVRNALLASAASTANAMNL